MTIKILAALAASTTLFAGAAFADGHTADWPESFTIGTGSQGGTYFGYGSGWGGIV